MTAACNRVVGLELILTSLKMATARSPAPTRHAAVILDGKFVQGAGASQGQCSRLAEALRAPRMREKRPKTSWAGRGQGLQASGRMRGTKCVGAVPGVTRANMGTPSAHDKRMSLDSCLGRSQRHG
jgi:hypothetical protein